MDTLVIGMGQIGSALADVLSAKYQVEGIDIGVNNKTKKFDFIHVCFPCSNVEKFVSTVKGYKDSYLKCNGICVIHSTVPVGVSKKCEAVHSPVRGIHPNLVSGIQTFVKYFGGKNATEAARVFEDLGIRTRVVADSDTTEALKLWDTTIYAWNVILEKEIHDWCEEHGVSFDIIYTDANRTYNEGYAALSRPEYQKYVLRHIPGKIGGHCLIPNAKLLDDWIADLVLQKNSEYPE
jgi:UDP-N-acetyl-D-mannosaminuronate dehydrogenase